MIFLAPIWFALAGAAAAGVVGLHFIASRRPAAVLLPTARFVPEGEAMAVARVARPSDVPLLALRVAALLLLGAAFAGPLFRVRGPASPRVVVVDRSRSARADAGDSARALWKDGDALVLFDSSARWITAGAFDSLRRLSPVGERGTLSAAIVAAIRAGRALAPHADSMEMLLISPMTSDELDSATFILLSQFPGRMRLVRTKAAAPVLPSINLAGVPADDELRPVAALLAPKTASGAATMRVHLLRHPLSASDSADARAGAAVVYWPATVGARPRAAGVWAGNATVVAAFSPTALVGNGRIVARWSDGGTAALETTLGGGCVRIVGIGTRGNGDLALGPAFLQLARQLLGPCAGASTFSAASDSLLRPFRRATAAPARATQEDALASPVAPWLAAAALVLLLVEMVSRRARVVTT